MVDFGRNAKAPQFGRYGSDSSDTIAFNDQPRSLDHRRRNRPSGHGPRLPDRVDRPVPPTTKFIARRARKLRNDQGPVSGIMSLAWAFAVERVTGIEPALSAWEPLRSRPSPSLTWHSWVPQVTANAP
ncbi:hypothetical protein GCM10010191_93780 [Actinomadura vinacea]|uniref:Uncharacterized protein n=1 Tax=Actinomadura vinacea TaxID=115336 RepID=A0ABN3KJ85_9ACTN